MRRRKAVWSPASAPPSKAKKSAKAVFRCLARGCGASVGKSEPAPVTNMCNKDGLPATSYCGTRAAKRTCAPSRANCKANSSLVTIFGTVTPGDTLLNDGAIDTTHGKCNASPSCGSSAKHSHHIWYFGLNAAHTSNIHTRTTLTPESGGDLASTNTSFVHVLHSLFPKVSAQEHNIWCNTPWRTSSSKLSSLKALRHRFRGFVKHE